MPNQIDSTGIQTKSLNDIIEDLTTAYTIIYGSDVNLDQNSPDGQLLNNIALIARDLADFITQDYSSKDPDQAVGVALDGISQLCGLSRLGGTYTLASITVTTDRILNLNGSTASTPFTISDTIGTEFELIDDEALISGANTLSFRAVEIGDVQISLNTLTTIVTPVLGVLSVNNPSAPSQQGSDQETDAGFRLRRQAAVALPAQSALAGLVGGLQTVDDLVQAVVYENITAAVVDGIPAGGIWVICDGGLSADIGAMIYLYRSQGIPMAGSETETITQVDATTIDMKFDYVTEEALYVNLNVSSKSSGSVDQTALKNAVAELTFSIYETADISTIVNAIYDYNTDIVVNSSGVSLSAGSYTSKITPSTKDNKFTISTANITVTVV